MIERKTFPTIVVVLCLSANLNRRASLLSKDLLGVARLLKLTIFNFQNEKLKSLILEQNHSLHLLKDNKFSKTNFLRTTQA